MTVDGMYSHTVHLARPDDITASRSRPLMVLPQTACSSLRTATPSLYEALELGISHRLSSRAQFEAHYTYAYSMTYSTFQGEPNTGLPNDFGNLGVAERGPSDYFQRHHLVINGYLRLPYSLQLSGVARLASGRPVNPLTGVDNNGDSNLIDRPGGCGSRRISRSRESDHGRHGARAHLCPSRAPDPRCAIRSV